MRYFFCNSFLFIFSDGLIYCSACLSLRYWHRAKRSLTDPNVFSLLEHLLFSSRSQCDQVLNFYGNDYFLLIMPQFIWSRPYRDACTWREEIAGEHRTWKLHFDFRIHIKTAWIMLPKKIACFFIQSHLGQRPHNFQVPEAVRTQRQASLLLISSLVLYWPTSENCLLELMLSAGSRN